MDWVGPSVTVDGSRLGLLCFRTCQESVCEGELECHLNYTVLGPFYSTPGTPENLGDFPLSFRGYQRSM